MAGKLVRQTLITVEYIVALFLLVLLIDVGFSAGWWAALCALGAFFLGLVFATAAGLHRHVQPAPEQDA